MLPKEDPCGLGQILLGLRRGLELHQQRERLAPHGLLNQSWLMQPGLSKDGLQPNGRSSDPALTAGTFQRRGELWPSQPGSVRRCRRDGQHRARIGVSQATWSPILEGLQEGRVLLAQQGTEWVDDVLSVPDSILLGTREDGDRLGQLGVGW